MASRTPRAFGAHTANRVPATPACTIGSEPERLPQLLVPALADQVQVQLAERGQEAVRVVHHVLAVVVRHREPVLRRHGVQRQHRGEQPVALRRQVGALPVQHDRHRPGVRPQRPEPHAAVHRVRAQQAVRVVVRAVQQPPPVARRDAAGRPSPESPAASEPAGPAGASGPWALRACPAPSPAPPRPASAPVRPAASAAARRRRRRPPGRARPSRRPAAPWPRPRAAGYRVRSRARTPRRRVSRRARSAVSAGRVRRCGESRVVLLGRIGAVSGGISAGAAGERGQSGEAARRARADSGMGSHAGRCRAS